MTDVLTQRVLVLNKSYSPVNIISVRDAFTKVFTRIAEIVSIEDGVYCSYDFTSWTELSSLKHRLQELSDPEDMLFTPRFVLAVPRVIRLLFYSRVPATQVKLNRRNLYARDLNTCQYCGRRLPTDRLNIDHVVPKSRGGRNTWTNLVCACLECNTRKGGKTPREAGMKLVRRPVKPVYNPDIHIHASQKRYESWKSFISEAYWTTSLPED